MNEVPRSSVLESAFCAIALEQVDRGMSGNVTSVSNERRILTLIINMIAIIIITFQTAPTPKRPIEEELDGGRRSRDSNQSVLHQSAINERRAINHDSLENTLAAAPINSPRRIARRVTSRATSFVPRYLTIVTQFCFPTHNNRSTCPRARRKCRLG